MDIVNVKINRKKNKINGDKTIINNIIVNKNGIRKLKSSVAQLTKERIEECDCEKIK